MVSDLNLHSLLETAPDEAELGQIVRELGYRLPKAAPRELRELRAEVATLRDRPEMERPERAFVRGALFAMAELCASYETEIEAREERERHSSFGVERPLHNALLVKVFAGMTRPTDLAEVLGKDKGQISRALNELRTAGLLELVSPGPIGDQRQRLYRVTTEGLRILSAQGWQANPGKPVSFADDPLPTKAKMRVKRPAASAAVSKP
ncbi:MAG TPA: hypothetical protein VL025_18625 [Thermoanaerobaculia bacterium]|nr:hypothetical protein [Thermoanaerobaculia bacterium]